jgi:hypothetical protein
MRNKILKQKEISVESKMARAEWIVTSGEWRMANKKAHLENSTQAFSFRSNTIRNFSGF